MSEPRSLAEQLVAIALLRQVLLDRDEQVGRKPEDYVAMFPEAPQVVLQELQSLGSETPVDVPGPKADAVLGHYRLRRLLARGGQAEVWHAQDVELADRDVALKVIRLTGPAAAGAAMRLRREIDVMVRLDVPGVCPVFDTGFDDGCAWIAMRLVAGASLASMLREKPGVPTAEVVRERLTWLAACARIVHSVHRGGVLHRDLKPGNVMIENGIPVVLDFGVARALEEVDDVVTATGAPVGTPAYMAPEQVRGVQYLGPGADIWALGVMLYEATTGNRPFVHDSRFELHERIVRDEPQPVCQANPKAPRDLATVIATALAKDPAQRYRTALDLADDLQRVLERRPVQARPAGVVLRVARFAQRRPGVFVLLVVLLLVSQLACFGGLLLWENVERERIRADVASKFVQHMADYHRLRSLRTEIAESLAIDSRRLGDFERVHRIGEELLGRRAMHVQFLEDLRRGAVPGVARTVGELRVEREQIVERTQFENALRFQEQVVREARASGDPERIGTSEAALADVRGLLASAVARTNAPSRWQFEDPEIQSVHDLVAELVTMLDQLAERRPGLPTALAARILWREAMTIRKRSLEDHEQSWTAARARIADPEGPYAGLQIDPQEGLVPLGPDPRSRLEEFAHVASGPLPARDPQTGELQYEARSALVLVLLPGANAVVGARDPERVRSFPEPRGGVPPVTVVPLAPFFLGKHEVTQAQWHTVMHRLDATFQQKVVGPSGTPTSLPRNPIETVESSAADRFAHRLGLVLPTEAQWEYACRAGVGTDFHFGSDATAMVRHGNVFELAGGLPQEPPADGYPAHAAVGTFAPNAFGLHEMHGNVAEWTADHHGGYELLPMGPAGRRPTGPFKSRVVRGGSFQRPVWEARCFARRVEPPHHALEDVGLRVARAVGSEPPK